MFYIRTYGWFVLSHITYITEITKGARDADEFYLHIIGHTELFQISNYRKELNIYEIHANLLYAIRHPGAF